MNDITFVPKHIGHEFAFIVLLFSVSCPQCHAFKEPETPAPGSFPLCCMTPQEHIFCDRPLKQHNFVGNNSEQPHVWSTPVVPKNTTYSRCQLGRVWTKAIFYYQMPFERATRRPKWCFVVLNETKVIEKCAANSAENFCSLMSTADICDTWRHRWRWSWRLVSAFTDIWTVNVNYQRASIHHLTFTSEYELFISLSFSLWQRELHPVLSL